MTMRAMALMALLIGGAQAEAGVRASYRIAEEKTPLIVEIADNGDASFAQPGGEVRVVVMGGHAFIVGEFDDGLQTVSLMDLSRALQKTGTPRLELDEPIPAISPALDNLVARPVGTRSVAGVSGTVYRMTAGKGVTIEGGDELVATGAPELRSIGKAAEVILAEGGGVLTLFEEAGPFVARAVRLLSRLVTLGTPLEWKGIYELRGLETVRIPPETIALPGPPVSPEALVARIRALTPGT
ncbi:hypothetical protein [Sphingomonas solaris]|uniref:Uncharacterized protein n=1 Tax=Alterirhizorhabdus solaris TaxID=2529389 RepID=A0A558R1D2_9SPHN|nr:hypothetical protein [Sphingomonas solaris]TVV73187.1 hypothetical protein FOY91_12925 [Sphingomonas solaris]